MKPSGQSDLDSLYFTYPHFEFRRPAELEGPAPRHRVVIAGAGPVGITAAIELARRGIASVLLDKKSTLNDGSRAICISRSSLETLQQLGLAEPFVAKGLGWTHGRCYYRDHMIYRLEMPHCDQERFFPMYNIQQQYIEQFLVDKATTYPELIDMRWQSEVVGLKTSEDSVLLTVRTPEGEYELQADYLLAADGGKSPTRKMLGLRMNGDNLPGNYVIADIQMEHDFPTERRSFFESKANRDATILIHKQPDNIWRVDWQILNDQNHDEVMREENIRTRVQAILDMIGHTGPWELEWWSIYTANTLCLDTYRHGRVLFLGDSAHIVPIFGVRGLNNGFSDAVNAAWKLAYVLKGEAHESLLDSYTPERRGATLDVFNSAGKSSRFMTPPTRGYKLLRKAALQLSVGQEFTRRFADPRQVQPYTYRASPITSFSNRDAAMSEGPQAGAPAINRHIVGDDYLLDHLGPGFTGLYFNEQPALPDALRQLFQQLKEIDHDFTPIIISRPQVQQGSQSSIEDATGSSFAGYGARDGTFYLLRPDRHVAARWLSVDTQEVKEALHTALGR